MRPGGGGVNLLFLYKLYAGMRGEKEEDNVKEDGVPRKKERWEKCDGMSWCVNVPSRAELISQVDEEEKKGRRETGR